MSDGNLCFIVNRGIWLTKSNYGKFAIECKMIIKNGKSFNKMSIMHKIYYIYLSLPIKTKKLLMLKILRKICQYACNWTMHHFSQFRLVFPKTLKQNNDWKFFIFFRHLDNLGWNMCLYIQLTPSWSLSSCQTKGVLQMLWVVLTVEIWNLQF